MCTNIIYRKDFLAYFSYTQLFAIYFDSQWLTFY